MIDKFSIKTFESDNKYPQISLVNCGCGGWWIGCTKHQNLFYAKIENIRKYIADKLHILK